MIITLDGPAGAGKSSAARALAARLGWCYMDTGAMYRALALVALETQVPLDDPARIAALAESLAISFRDGRVFVDQRDVSTEIRTERVTVATRPVADAAEVREVMKRMQRRLAAGIDVVTEGRDQGSVVFPGADLKVFLTATAETRAERRYKQLMEKGLAANLAFILHDLRMRDARDSGRAVAPLQAGAPEAVLDSDDLTIEEVVAIILERYRIAVRVQASGRSAGAGGSTLQD
jgi:cytidylate kinase